MSEVGGTHRSYARLGRTAVERRVRSRLLRKSRSYWHETAIPDITAGAGCVILACALMLLAIGKLPAMIGGILLVVVIPIEHVLLSRFLVEEFVIPGGLPIKMQALEKDTGPAVLMTSVAYVALGAAAVFARYPRSVLVGCLVALLLLGVYAFSSRKRYFVLSVAGLVICSLLPLLLFRQGLGLVWAVALTLLAFGLCLVLAGVVTFMRLHTRLVSSNIEYEPGEDAIAAVMLSQWHTPDEIADALASDDPGLRLMVAAFLSTYIEPQVLPALLVACHDADEDVAWMAQRSFSNIWGPSVDEVLKWYRFGQLGDGGRKRAAHKGDEADEHAQMEEYQRQQARVIAQIDRHVHEVQEVLRGRVASDEMALDALVRLARGDGTVDARTTALEALGSTRAHRAYAVLVETIMSNGADRPIVAAALRGFSGAASPAVVHLERLLGGSRTWMRVAGCDAAIVLIRSIEHEDHADARLARAMLRDRVFALASKEGPVVRAALCELLALYGQEASGVLDTWCTDRSAFVRGESLRALALVDGARAHAHVLAALGDPRAYVRGKGLDCVAFLRLADAQDAVRVLLQDADPSIASMAQQVLALFSLFEVSSS
ncbi:MAG: hypothetical protein IIZ15_03990 [Coriobacteriales bacterium]|jgi:HEAT repeat protein|nr:hypothetical protein [Coriobacteriales bacterium]